MKVLLITLSTLLLSFTTFTDNVIDRIGVKGPLEFNKNDFKLTWTSKPNDSYFIQEYLPKDEKLENFNQMLTIHLFVTNIETKNAVQQKVIELTQRKKTDPVCNYQIIESPDGKEFIIDFLLSESKGEKMTIAEFSVYRYKQIDIENDKKAIMVYAYSKRSYGDNISSFFKTIKDDRTVILNEMISIDLPKLAVQ